MTPDATVAALSEPLHAWLTSDDHEVQGWAADPPIEQLHCHPDLAERLTQMARPVRGTCRVWIDGCPVVHHPSGPPIACATGTSRLVVRSAQPAGALVSQWRTPGLDGAWVDLDPWAADVTFTRTLELLRTHLRRAVRTRGDGRVALTWISWNAAVEAGVVVGAAGIAARMSARRWLAASAAFAREFAIVLVLYAMWRIVGTVSVLKVNGAIQAGERIWDLERALHLPNERGLQHLFLKSDELIQACNVYYASVHIPSMLVFLPWLWFRHRADYPPVRNVIALSTLWCLALQLIPVAPPRLVPSLHVLDTPMLYGQTVYPSFGKSGPAQLSAMPSVHVAWAVIIGVVVVLVSTSRWRWLALAHTVVTSIVVVVTGNHYWLDGVVAVGVVALAVVFERWARGVITRRLAARPVRTPGRAPVGSGHGSPA